MDELIQKMLEVKATEICFTEGEKPWALIQGQRHSFMSRILSKEYILQLVAGYFPHLDFSSLQSQPQKSLIHIAGESYPVKAFFENNQYKLVFYLTTTKTQAVTQASGMSPTPSTTGFDEQISDPFISLDAMHCCLFSNDTQMSKRLEKIDFFRHYSVVQVLSAKELDSLFKYGLPGILILDDRFPEFGRGMKIMNQMSLFDRMQIFVLVVSQRLKSFDKQVAFQLSVDSILNDKDLDQIKKVLEVDFSIFKKEKEQFDEFYCPR